MRRRYRDLSIRTKLLAPFAILMLVWGAFGSYVLARGSAGEARGRATAQLALALDHARAAFSDTERSLIETVRLATNTEGVADAMARNDRRLLQALLSPIAVNSQHDLLIVVDRTGRSIVEIDTSGARPNVRAGTRTTLPAILRAAKGQRDGTGDKWSGMTQQMFVVAGPVRARGGNAVGAVAVAEPLSRIAVGMARGGDLKVGIFDPEGTLVASTRGVRFPHRPAVDGVRASVTIDGVAFEALYAPLEARGARLGQVAVGLESSVALKGVGRTAVMLALLVAFAVVAAAGIGIFTARAITRPVAGLVDATRSLERGDLGTRAPVHAGDEIGSLASSFNRMASELESSHAELERKVAERTAELERVNREIAVANEELARASAMKSTFLATMSHELRTPLNAIIGFADMLHDPTFGRPDVKTTRELAGNILKSGRHLLTIINDVLDLAKVEAGRIEIVPEPTDLAALMEEVAAVVRPLADAKRQTLLVHHASERLTVHADPGRLRQILFNLVANAIKFTPERGAIRVLAEPGQGVATIKVSDTGPGLTPEEAAKIFDPFERGAQSRSVEGAGLGLALAKRLVEMSGGDIRVTSRPGKGCTFSFTMPYASQLAEAASS